MNVAAKNKLTTTIPVDYTSASTGRDYPQCGRISADRWFVWRAKPSQEKLALREISALGFRTYLPLFVKGRSEEGEEAIRSLFGPYGFVSLDTASNGWVNIRYCRGVLDLIGADTGRPCAVPAGIVEALQARGRPGDGVIDEFYQGATFDPLDGQRVRIIAGPFADLHGLCRWSNQKRIAVPLEVMGGLVETEIRRSDVIPSKPISTQEFPMPLDRVKSPGKQVSVSQKGRIDLKEPEPRKVKAVETTGNTPGNVIKPGGKSLGYKG